MHLVNRILNADAVVRTISQLRNVFLAPCRVPRNVMSKLEDKAFNTEYHVYNAATNKRVKARHILLPNMIKPQSVVVRCKKGFKPVKGYEEMNISCLRWKTSLCGHQSCQMREKRWCLIIEDCGCKRVPA